MESTFYNTSRWGNDNEYLDQRTIQNTNNSNYVLQNYFMEDTTMSKPIHVATMQPNVFYKGCNSVGQNGFNINENSQLSIGSVQTHPRCRIDLTQRPFVTVPFLGRGSVDPVMESQMMIGETYTNKKSYNQLSERSYIPYSTTPLIDSIKSTISNPEYLVEGVAAQGWIRGGVPSREIHRDNTSNKSSH
jgi:hypothetical protein